MPIAFPEELVQGLEPQSLRYLGEAVDQLVSPAGLIPFVGAGLSMELGMPGWGGFLRSIAPPEIAVEVDKMLNDGKYEEAAEKCLLVLKAPAFNEKLRTKFDRRRTDLVDELSNRAAELIPLIARGLVITTNFDKILEAAFERAGRPLNDEECIAGTRYQTLWRLRKKGQRALWKIHGDVLDEQGRVLTRQQYEAAYGGTDGRSPADALREVAESGSLLIVGASLLTDRTTQCFLEAAEQLGGASHFAFLSQPDADKCAGRTDQLLNWGIRPIYYPAGQHTWNRKLLEFLASQLTPRRRRPPWPPRLKFSKVAWATGAAFCLVAMGVGAWTVVQQQRDAAVLEEAAKASADALKRAQIAHAKKVASESLRDAVELAKRESERDHYVAIMSAVVAALINNGEMAKAQLLANDAKDVKDELLLEIVRNTPNAEDALNAIVPQIGEAARKADALLLIVRGHLKSQYRFDRAKSIVSRMDKSLPGDTARSQALLALVEAAIKKGDLDDARSLAGDMRNGELKRLGAAYIATSMIRAGKSAEGRAELLKLQGEDTVVWPAMSTGAIALGVMGNLQWAIELAMRMKSPRLPLRDLAVGLAREDRGAAAEQVAAAIDGIPYKQETVLIQVPVGTSLFFGPRDMRITRPETRFIMVPGEVGVTTKSVRAEILAIQGKSSDDAVMASLNNLERTYVLGAQAREAVKAGRLSEAAELLRSSEQPEEGVIAAVSESLLEKGDVFQAVSIAELGHSSEFVARVLLNIVRYQLKYGYGETAAIETAGRIPKDQKVVSGQAVQLITHARAAREKLQSTKSVRSIEVPTVRAFACIGLAEAAMENVRRLEYVSDGSD